MMDPGLVALIGVDWGTSSLRVSAMDAHGALLAEEKSARGILTIEPDGFGVVLDSVLSGWSVAPTVPVVLSGMITSRNGWQETPYLEAPCELLALASSMLTHTDGSGRSLYFVPGVQQLESGTADVMRGEETELFGWLARQRATNAQSLSGAEKRTFLLPGTHSKWVQTEGTAIQSFVTCMTGELFALLSEHSILSRLMTSDRPANPAAFTQGAKQGLAEPAKLLSKLFSVRAMPLLGALPTDDVQDYLAGLLIGAEVATQAATQERPIVVIGRGDLTERYVSVLALAGQSAERAEPGAAYAGQFELACRADLL
ncbi:MAG: 2-dehydro-3-deoxygalactonokinase [Burkholderiaceae bacterium]